MSTSITSTQRTIPAQANHHGSACKTLVAAGRALARRLSLIYDIYGERRQMRNLSDATLNDLGITRAQLNEECRQSILNLPRNRS